MAGSNQDDDNWEFKLDSKDLETANLKKKAKKASGATPDINSVHKPKRKKKLSVNNPRKKQGSRSAIARRTAAAEAYAELMAPSFLNRIFATIFDYGFVAAMGYGSYLLRPHLEYYYIEELAKRGINQTLDPATLEKFLIIPVFIVLVFLLHLVPAMKFNATIGKSLFKMRISGHTIGERASKKAIFMREAIFKPVSIVSVIGLLVGLKNEGNRPLHDMICGTALYIDD
jgi:uncharacterized RDD family membrane protein YckC